MVDKDLQKKVDAYTVFNTSSEAFNELNALNQNAPTDLNPEQIEGMANVLLDFRAVNQIKQSVSEPSELTDDQVDELAAINGRFNTLTSTFASQYALQKASMPIMRARMLAAVSASSDLQPIQP